MNVGVLGFGVPLLGQSDPWFRHEVKLKLQTFLELLTNVTPSSQTLLHFSVSLPKWCSLVRLPLAACSDHMLLVLQNSEVLPKPGEQLGGVPMPAAMALRKRAPTYLGASIPWINYTQLQCCQRHLRCKVNVAVLTSTQDDRICGHHSALSGMALATRTQDG